MAKAKVKPREVGNHTDLYLVRVKPDFISPNTKFFYVVAGSFEEAAYLAQGNDIVVKIELVGMQLNPGSVVFQEVRG